MSAGSVFFAIFLVAINGFFVAVEFAYTASRRPVLEGLRDNGNRFARWALASMDELPVTFAGAQLGVAAASLTLGVVIETSLEAAFEDLYHLLSLPEGAITTLSLVSALILASFVHNVFGEMAPKNATIAAPEKAALILAAPFRGYVTVLRPIIWLLSSAAGGILRLFGVEAKKSVEISHSAEDIASLVKTVGAGGIIDSSSSSLLGSALRFQDTLVSEVMVPRPDLVTLSLATPAGQYEQTVVRTGHSRIPVYGSGLDDIRGFVHAKDLLRIDDDDRSSPIDPGLLRNIPVVPETMSVSPLMESMRNEGVHLAVVIDEHGSVSGLVTLEDIAEELVGDIRDEHDIREVMEIRAAGRNRFLVAGQTRIDRLEDVGAHIPDGEYETVGGYLMDRLGQVPKRGDLVEDDSLSMRVRRMDGRRVREVEMTISPGQED